MQICKYCNELMIGEYETLSNNSYFFFYNCPKCRSIYEGKVKKNRNEFRVLEERWFNPKKNDFE